ncbi:Protein CBG26809 [Caenorhabditis briggsae]|uniref:Uncharacterized protein n=2 Tax=Caenorhabditis briggsae TaxID=6238 RepID=A0AAE8ZSR9_CAEBR|nr:Protein CBG26809 [Caenorhabditis briggsae]ULT81453.1 hypothetical protein L3Y34_011399 [Caenorhabditis briggsae]CAR99655.1 Protein CBG26809 [Caenorhabditis briggsae]
MVQRKIKEVDPSKKKKVGRPPKRKFFGPPGYVRPTKNAQPTEAAPSNAPAEVASEKQSTETTDAET